MARQVALDRIMIGFNGTSTPTSLIFTPTSCFRTLTWAGWSTSEPMPASA
nr:phage major capsid protein, P2 family [Escherichia coli]